jgi:hypothetical protein
LPSALYRHDSVLLLKHRNLPRQLKCQFFQCSQSFAHVITVTRLIFTRNLKRLKTLKFSQQTSEAELTTESEKSVIIFIRDSHFFAFQIRDEILENRDRNGRPYDVALLLETATRFESLASVFEQIGRDLSGGWRPSARQNESHQRHQKKPAVNNFEAAKVMRNRLFRSLFWFVLFRLGKNSGVEVTKEALNWLWS